MDPATDAGSDARGQPAPDHTTSRVEVRPEPLDSPVALELIAALNEELSRDYPPSQRFHSLAAGEVAEGSGAFLVAWLDGAPAGCGAVRMLPADEILGSGVAELKRMYVVPAVRGQGLSRAILSELETRASGPGRHPSRARDRRQGPRRAVALRVRRLRANPVLRRVRGLADEHLLREASRMRRAQKTTYSGVF